jgi:hypothetical protein
MSITAMKQALEALKAVRHGHCDHAWADEAIADLDATIEAAEKPLAWADEIIADLHALYDSEMITENDSGDALIRLDAAICAVEEAEERHTTPPAAQRERVVFPTMLRKMWSGGEVQAWLDENVNGITGEKT